MSTPIHPSTPATPTSKPTTPSTPSTPSTPITGTWRHPQFDEIARRQNASNFTDRNAKKATYNVGSLIVLWFLARWLWNAFPNSFQAGKLFHPYATYIYHTMQVVLAYNTVVAFWPLFRAKDDLSDIALTPAQRKLLGLQPSSKPPTPGSQYITPPRYARTPTPLGGSPGSKGSYSNSPISGSPLQNSRSGSPFSPGATPFLQKAMGGAGLNGSRRHSYGSPSPLGPGASRVGIPETPGTPSPTAAKGASVGLNNRWLFEKGRRNSGTPRLYA